MKQSALLLTLLFMANWLLAQEPLMDHSPYKYLQDLPISIIEDAYPSDLAYQKNHVKTELLIHLDSAKGDTTLLHYDRQGRLIFEGDTRHINASYIYTYKKIKDTLIRSCYNQTTDTSYLSEQDKFLFNKNGKVVQELTLEWERDGNTCSFCDKRTKLIYDTKGRLAYFFRYLPQKDPEGGPEFQNPQMEFEYYWSDKNQLDSVRDIGPYQQYKTTWRLYYNSDNQFLYSTAKSKENFKYYHTAHDIVDSCTLQRNRTQTALTIMHHFIQNDSLKVIYQQEEEVDQWLPNGLLARRHRKSPDIISNEDIQYIYRYYR